MQLSLVSGRPISFIQDLYQPLYVPRPVVQPELYASLRPQTYDAGIQRMQEAEAMQQMAKKAEGNRRRDFAARAAPAAPSAAAEPAAEEPAPAEAKPIDATSSARLGPSRRTTKPSSTFAPRASARS